MKTRTYTQKKSNKSSLFYKITVTSANSIKLMSPIIFQNCLLYPFLTTICYNFL